MKICPKCGYEAASSEYCRNCGVQMLIMPGLREKLTWHGIGTFIVWLAQFFAIRFFASPLGDIYEDAVTYYFTVWLVAAGILIATENPVWRRSGRKIKAYIIYEALIGAALAVILFFFLYIGGFIGIVTFAIPFLALNLAAGFYLIGIGKRRQYILLNILRAVLTTAGIYVLFVTAYPLIWAVVAAELVSSAFAITLLAKLAKR
jgi:hypothetical protein